MAKYDSHCNDALNNDLSKRRAELVKHDLTSKFVIEASRMDTEDAGEGKTVYYSLFFSSFG